MQKINHVVNDFVEGMEIKKMCGVSLWMEKRKQHDLVYFYSVFVPGQCRFRPNEYPIYWQDKYAGLYSSLDVFWKFERPLKHLYVPKNTYASQKTFRRPKKYLDASNF